MNWERVFGRQSRLWGLLVIVFILIGWELLSRSDPALGALFPPFSQVVASYGDLVTTGFTRVTLQEHTLVSLVRYTEGYALALVIAIPLGLVLGYWSKLHDLFEPIIELMRPLPSVAVIPILWLILGMLTDLWRIAIIAYACTWPILINTMDGVHNADPVLINTSRTFGFSRRQTLTRIILPSAAPLVVSGMRVSLTTALIIVIGSEMIFSGNSMGLGYLIWQTMQVGNYNFTYAGIIFTILLGYILNFVYLRLEHRFMAWHVGFTRAEA